jgi:chemotaxis protein MotB
VSGRKKKHHEEEHENHERWLVSYADLVTLLFCFFVVMYSVSRVDNKKLQQVTQSIQWAMHYGGTGGIGQMPIFDGPPSEGGGVAGLTGAKQISPEQRQAIEAFRRRVENKVRPYILERAGSVAVTVEVEDKLVKVRLAAGDFFEAGESALRPQVLPVLDAIAEEILPLGRPIQIEGHTDDQPVHGIRFRDNWELSAARAATVTSYLEKAHKVAPRLLSAAGYSDTRPIAKGDSAADREANRRVEMVLELDLPSTPPQRQQRPQSQGPTSIPSVH